MTDLLASHAYAPMHISSPVIFIVNAGRHHIGYSWSQSSEQQCSTVHGASARDRFVWFDLNAGPLEWGPLSAGEGSALRHAFPFIDNQIVRQKELLVAVAG